MEKVYIGLDSSLINKPEVKLTKGIEESSSLPPFYVPQGLFVTEDETQNRLTIKLSYTNEPNEGRYDAILTDGVVLSLGKKSDRIYCMKLSLSVLNELYEKSSSKEDFFSNFKDIITKYQQTHETAPKNSFAAAKSVIENYGSQVFTLAH